VFFLLFVLVNSISINIEETDFIAWMKVHRKLYPTVQEYNTRFQIFKQSKLDVQSLTRRYPSTSWKLNKFADLTKEEFSAIYLRNFTLLNTDASDIHLKQERRSVSQIPQSVDWRTKDVIFPVQLEPQCGGTILAAPVEHVQTAWMINNGLTTANFPPIDSHQVIDCNSFPCTTTPNFIYQSIVKTGLADDFTSCPIVPNVCISNFQAPTLPESDLLGLLNQSPFGVGIDATNWQFYDSGILTAAECGTSHDSVVLAVGYDISNSAPYWILRNYWGTDWGEQGYIRLQYGTNTCGIAELPFEVTAKKIGTFTPQ